MAVCQKPFVNFVTNSSTSSSQLTLILTPTLYTTVHSVGLVTRWLTQDPCNFWCCRNTCEPNQLSFRKKGELVSQQPKVADLFRDSISHPQSMKSPLLNADLLGAKRRRKQTPRTPLSSSKNTRYSSDPTLVFARPLVLSRSCPRCC